MANCLILRRWTPKKPITWVDLGTAKTFSIPTILPDVQFGSLSESNFFILDTGTYGFQRYNNNKTTITWAYDISYDKSTGTLNTSISTSGGESIKGTSSCGCHMIYVSDPSELVSFENMKTEYPNEWQSFTKDNFITNRFNTATASYNTQGNFYSGVHKSGSDSYSESDEYCEKSYDQSTGDLTFRMNCRWGTQQYNNYTVYMEHDQVYIIK